MLVLLYPRLKKTTRQATPNLRQTKKHSDMRSHEINDRKTINFTVVTGRIPLTRF